MIIHHSEIGWTATTRFQGLFEPALVADEILQRLTPDFEVVVDDISHRTDAELRARALGPMALLGLLFLRDGRREGRILEELPDWADLFRALWNSPNGRRVIQQLFSCLFRVTPNLDRSALEETIRQVIPETEELVMTLAEQLIEQGLSKGVSQGKRGVVRKQLELKFGVLTEDTLRRIESGDETMLERIAERVLFAESLADVFFANDPASGRDSASATLMTSPAGTDKAVSLGTTPPAGKTTSPDCPQARPLRRCRGQASGRSGGAQVLKAPSTHECFSVLLERGTGVRAQPEGENGELSRSGLELSALPW